MKTKNFICLDMDDAFSPIINADNIEKCEKAIDCTPVFDVATSDVMVFIHNATLDFIRDNFPEFKHNGFKEWLGENKGYIRGMTWICD
jgi:hypothetical protein